MIKKLIPALLVAAVALATPGCGGGSDDEIEQIIDVYERGGSLSQRERDLLEEEYQERQGQQP
jgi:hypothetical protein